MNPRTRHHGAPRGIPVESNEGKEDFAARPPVASLRPVLTMARNRCSPWPGIDAHHGRNPHHGPGYRLYFTRRGVEIVILLAGGDKSTQHKDIERALALARQLMENGR